MKQGVGKPAKLFKVAQTSRDGLRELLAPSLSMIAHSHLRFSEYVYGPLKNGRMGVARAAPTRVRPWPDCGGISQDRVKSGSVCIAPASVKLTKVASSLHAGYAMLRPTPNTCTDTCSRAVTDTVESLSGDRQGSKCYLCFFYSLDTATITTR